MTKTVKQRKGVFITVALIAGLAIGLYFFMFIMVSTR